MKKLVLVTLSTAFGFGLFAQETPEQLLKRIENSDTTEVIEKEVKEKSLSPLEKDIQKVEEQKKVADTTTLRFGNRRIVIIEKDGSTSVEIPDKNESFSVSKDRDRSFTYKKKPRFKGHWAGFEWGFNGLMDPNFSMNMKDDLRYLELKQGRSWNLNLNIMQYSLGFGTDKVGLVTGLGLEFNNYHFRNAITLTPNSTYTTVDSSYIHDNKNVSRSKLSTTHITLPLLLEFQIPTYNDKHRIFFSTGVIGGVRIGSSTKVVYEGPSKGKDKVKDDFNMSSFRYGLTARVGYRGLKLFANYYPTSLFESGKGDEVYPFSVGLILLSFN